MFHLLITAAIPSITVFTLTDNPIIGSPFSICCMATGIPQPNITWKKDGAPLESTEDGVLQIAQFDNGRTSSVEVSKGRREFNGVYECTAMNAAGSVMQFTRVELQG